MTFAENKNDTFVKDVIKRYLTTPSLFLKGELPVILKKSTSMNMQDFNPK